MTDNDKDNSEKKSTIKSNTRNTIPITQLFRFSTPLDKFYMLIGTIAAICNGVSLPFMTIIFSGFIDTFARFSLALSIHNSTGDEENFEIAKKEFDSDVRKHASYFLILGAAIFLVSYIQ